jgi:hypothetical protein
LICEIIRNNFPAEQPVHNMRSRVWGGNANVERPVWEWRLFKVSPPGSKGLTWGNSRDICWVAQGSEISNVLHTEQFLFVSNSLQLIRIWDLSEILRSDEDKVISIETVGALRFARGLGSLVFWYSVDRWRQGCQSYAPAAFYSQENSCYSFLLEVDSSPRP